MDRKKAILVAVLGMVALSAGNMLSGYLTLMLLKLDAAPLQWNTYWSYVRALELPQLAPYIGKIKLSGYIGFGLPLMAWLAFVAWPSMECSSRPRAASWWASSAASCFGFLASSS